MIVAESLGKEEALRSEYLVGPTGQLMDRLISRTKHPLRGTPLSREMFGLENTVHCQPPGDNLWAKEWVGAFDHCRPYLEESIAKVQPKVILALGAGALKWFTGHSNIEKCHGYAFETQWGIVVPTFHPAYLLRGKMHLAEVWMHDLCKAITIAEKGLTRRPFNLNLFPTPDQAWDFVARYKAAGEPLLAADIETPYSGRRDEDKVGEWDDEEEASSFEGYETEDPSYTVIRCSFAFDEEEAITFPWMYPFTEVGRELLASNGDKTFHNHAYDVPRLEAKGFPVNGLIHDSMLYFGRLRPGLPKSLAFVAPLYTDLPEWKSENNARPEYYAALDVIAGIRVTNRIIEALKKSGAWEMALRHIGKVNSVLHRMSRRGTRVDRPTRALRRIEFSRRLEGLIEELQTHIPEDLFPRTVYKVKPSTLRKKGFNLDGPEWRKIEVEIDLKEGWMVGEDGEECKIPKVKKPRKSKKKPEPAQGVLLSE
jgi:uracil-DNA glycosylase family 4